MLLPSVPRRVASKIATVSVVGVMGLAACSTSTINSVDRMTPQGNEFDSAIRAEYLALARSENDQLDFADADMYAVKARRASEGRTLGPDELSKRKLPPETVGEIQGARDRLTVALREQAATKSPKPAARAQAMFDCWMEQQEENFQPEDIAACREGFTLAMAEVDRAIAPPPIAAVAPRQPPAPVVAPPPVQKVSIPAPLPEPLIVYFKNNSANLTGKERGSVADLVDAFKAANGATIVVAGHADLTGEDSYNDDLSLKRAKRVADVLTASGVPSTAIDIRSFGARNPKIPTGRGVSERRNRVVEINFVR